MVRSLGRGVALLISAFRIGLVFGARPCTEETPPLRLTNLPGQWLQCEANGSNVCRVLRPGADREESSRGAFPPGSYLRRIDFCITQLKDQGPSRTCNESKEDEVFHRGSALLGCDQW